MDPFTTLEFPQGRVSYSGSVRFSDGGTESFCIEIENNPPLYGSWQSKFINENYFDVNIVHFGYTKKQNIDNTNQRARLKLNDLDIIRVRELITRLFEYISMTKLTIPFNLNNANYTGNINFLDGWVEQVAQ